MGRCAGKGDCRFVSHSAYLLNGLMKLWTIDERAVSIRQQAWCMEYGWMCGHMEF